MFFFFASLPTSTTTKGKTWDFYKITRIFPEKKYLQNVSLFRIMRDILIEFLQRLNITPPYPQCDNLLNISANDMKLLRVVQIKVL